MDDTGNFHGEDNVDSIVVPLQKDSHIETLTSPAGEKLCHLLPLLFMRPHRATFTRTGPSEQVTALQQLLWLKARLRLGLFQPRQRGRGLQRAGAPS